MAATGDHVDRIQAEWHRERPDVDVAPQAILGRMHRLATALTRELVEVYGQHGLGEGEFDVLCALRRAGPPYARKHSDLARSTMITTGAVTKRIDRLEAAGMVRRERPAGTDGRVKIVRLTDAGRALIDTAFTDHMHNEARLVSDLSPQDQEDLERILRTWLAAYER